MTVHENLAPACRSRHLVRWWDGVRNRSRAFTHERDAIAFAASVEDRERPADPLPPGPRRAPSPPKTGRGNRYAGQRAEQMVYAIVDDRADAVKIGVAVDPSTRLRDLQAGNASRLRLVAVTPGGRPLERALHKRLAAHRLREDGEWFALHPEVFAEVERFSVPEAA